MNQTAPCYSEIKPRRNQKGVKYQVSATEAQEWEKEVADWKNVDQWTAGVENQYQVKCQGAVVGDDKFVPHQEVEFLNLTENFEKMKELEESLPSPGTDEDPSEDQMEQLQDLTDQFQK